MSTDMTEDTWLAQHATQARHLSSAITQKGCLSEKILEF